MLDPKLLEILVCPQCRGDLLLDRGHPGLACRRCRLLFEIRGDIPILLIDEARPYDPDESSPAQG